eukprot:4512164-Lingulodinium_polyedra.AAC.1
MSSPVYDFIGDITNWTLYKAVVQGLPKVAAETSTEAKTKAGKRELAKLERLARSGNPEFSEA